MIVGVVVVPVAVVTAPPPVVTALSAIVTAWTAIVTTPALCNSCTREYRQRYAQDKRTHTLLRIEFHHHLPHIANSTLCAVVRDRTELVHLLYICSWHLESG